MSEACFIVSQIFGLCLVSFQAHGQNTETCLDAPLNKERPFCCRDSSKASSGFKCGVPDLRVVGHTILETWPVRLRTFLALALARINQKPQGANEGKYSAAEIFDGCHFLSSFESFCQPILRGLGVFLFSFFVLTLLF